MSSCDRGCGCMTCAGQYTAVAYVYPHVCRRRSVKSWVTCGSERLLKRKRPTSRRSIPVNPPHFVIVMSKDAETYTLFTHAGLLRPAACVSPRRGWTRSGIRGRSARTSSSRRQQRRWRPRALRTAALRTGGCCPSALAQVTWNQTRTTAEPVGPCRGSPDRASSKGPVGCSRQGGHARAGGAAGPADTAAHAPPAARHPAIHAAARRDRCPPPLPGAPHLQQHPP